VLHAIGRAGAPVPRSIWSAFRRRRRAARLRHRLRPGGSAALGKSVVDAAMVDGASLLAAMFSGMLAGGAGTRRAATTCSTPARPVRSQETRMENRRHQLQRDKFYEDLLSRLGRGADLPRNGPGLASPGDSFSEKFREKTREWCAVFDGSDIVCAGTTFSKRAPCWRGAQHLHALRQGGPPFAPRFSRTPGRSATPPSAAATGAGRLGFSEIDALKNQGLGFA
jgi:alpha-methylacyl-CoA racemase